MSKYKAGDKVVVDIKDTYLSAYGIKCYGLNGIGDYSAERIDEKTEPLSTYTEPLEAKIRRQAAEITRLFEENKRLKVENGNVIWEIEQAFDRGCNEAWELARKGMLMSSTDREAIFGSGYNAMYGVLMYHTYQEAAAKVAEWEKAKEEIKRGDVVRDKYDTSSKFCVTDIDCDGHLYGVGKYGLTYSNQDPEYWEKTGCHIDIDGFLKQIGGEEE